jgi:transcriptional regulator with PAS, ATPase and Fis domain
MIAESIHQARSRFRGRSLLNCSAIPSKFICSELFDYAERVYGSEAIGKCRQVRSCNGGTLFLDEISDVCRNVRAALLQVLQEMEITRLGVSV